MKPSRNQHYWESHSHKYPFQCVTRLQGAPVPSPSFQERFGHTLRVPFPRNQEVWWGFETGRDRDNFVNRYHQNWIRNI